MRSKGIPAGRGLRSVLRRGRKIRETAVECLESRRLLSAGDLDPTFGAGGTITTDFPGSAGDRTRQTALQSDGKLVEVAWHGGFGVGEPTMAVTRFNTDGSVDTSFGDNGIRLVDFPGRGEILGSIEVGPGDKIVVATWSFFPTTDLLGADSDVSVAVLNPGGSFDTGFDGDGMKVFDLGQTYGGPAAAKTSDIVFDVAVQADGKVVTASAMSINNQSRFALARVNTDGTPDATFGTNGVVATPFANYSGGATAVTVDEQDRVVAAGTAGIPGANGRVTDQDFAVARYNPDGTPDTSFDGDGFIIVPVGTPGETVTAVSAAPGGKIVVAGGTAQNVPNSSVGDIAVVRLNDDGSRDATFDGDGVLVLPLTARNAQGQDVVTRETAQGLAVQDDGSIVLSGRNSAGVGTTFVGNTFVVRLDPSGALDPGFGDGGKVISELDEGVDVEVDPADASVLLGGHVIDSTTGFEDFAASRFDSAGNLDTSYGNGGIASADFPGPGFNAAADAAVDSQGRVVVGGFTIPRGSNRDLLFARYNPDGTLDAAFGTGGTAAIDLGDAFGNTERVTALAVDSEGRIVFAGVAADADGSGVENMLVGRLTPDGTLDDTFGTGGVVVVDDFAGSPTADTSAKDLLVQPDGRIVVAGSHSPSTATAEFAAVRLLDDGSLDGSFGADGNGMVHLSPGGQVGEANEAALAPDQDGDGFDLVLVGYAGASITQFAVVRLDDDGTPDAGFGTGGAVITPMGNGNAVANAVGVDDQGYVVVGGYARVTSPTSQGDNFALARFTPAGVLDATFGAGGKVTTDFNLGSDRVNGLVVLPDRSVVAGGEASGPANPTAGSVLDFGLARYTAAGQLDGTFGNGGKVMTNFTQGQFPGSPSVSRDTLTTLLAYPGGRVVAAGTAILPRTGSDFALARYTLVDAPPPAHVVGRRFVYNRSVYDGNDPAITDRELDAVPTDKEALLPGQSPTFANVSSYSRGINGIMVVFDRELAGLTADDFAFRVADGQPGGTWSPAPAPSAFGVRSLQIASGTIALFTWPDGAIRNTWLEVRVLANGRTRLASPDVFYFGNLVGETGDSPTTLRVNALDLAGVKRAQNTNSTITGRFDFNRDGRVNALDLAAARSNLNRTLAAPPASASALSATIDPATSLLREPDPS